VAVNGGFFTHPGEGGERVGFELGTEEIVGVFIYREIYVYVFAHCLSGKIIIQSTLHYCYKYNSSHTHRCKCREYSQETTTLPVPTHQATLRK